MSKGHRHSLIETDNVTLMKLATQFSVFIALSLVVVKLAAWVVTGSLSILSSLVDSAMDAATSVVNFLALRYSLRPPDERHRFGFGKAEPIASLIQALLIGASGVYIVVEGIARLRNPEPLTDGLLGIGIMGVSLLASIALVLFQRYVVRKTGSLVVRADSLHYVTDILSSTAVIASLALTYYGGVAAADVVLALLIAGFVMFSAFGIGYEAFHHLVDHELPESEREEIAARVKAHADVRGINDLKTRMSGQVRFIQFNLELDGNLPLRDAHRITHEIEDELLSRFPKAEVIIHQDVYGEEAHAHPRPPEGDSN